MDRINKNGLISWEIKRIIPGIVLISESQLPVKLPDKVKFGEGNPLTTNKEFVNISCPKCGSSAKRETDTMDTFVNSSWYYLRYTDPKNSRKIFDEKKVFYWTPIDQYIGGPEHITMHLIYIRFYAKFLKDLGLVKFDEPALRYFTQGIVHGSDGDRMSKSKGNVVEPLDTIEKFGADTLRLALVSFASPDSNTNWDEKTVLGSHKFLNKVFEHFSNIKYLKTFGSLDIYEYVGNSRPSYIDISDASIDYSYKKINAGHYIVNIKNAEKPFDIILRTSYNDLWQARIERSILDDHFVAYNYANGWNVRNTGNYNIYIVFKVWPWD